MAKAKTVYACTECGGQVLKWQGQCPHCQAWNTLVESVAEAAPSSNRCAMIAEGAGLQRLSEVEATEEARLSTGVAEFDRVLGGGLVAGGVVLIGGDPGIGKSTLLLQAACRLAGGLPVAYISGEEAVDHVHVEPGRVGRDDVAVALGGEGTVLDHARTYLRISLLGVPAMLLMLAGTGYLRGLLDTRTRLGTSSTTP